MKTNPIEAKLIPLAQIYPDPTQPRHLLPSDLAQAFETGASPSEILSQLRSRAEHTKWIRERIIELDALAASISEDGLMQPIRVIRIVQSPTQDHDSGDCYRIEEGERRWWAHHILVQQGQAQFQSIAAFVVDEPRESNGVLRRRVAENVLRSGFTAIELARALAIRIQEVMAAEPGIKRAEAEKQVGNENNLTDRRVRQYIALLTLVPETQELAQQARLTESALRHVVGIKDPSRQLEAIRQLMHPDQTTSKPKARQASSRQEKHLPKDPSKSNGKHKPKHETRLASCPAKRRKRSANSTKGKVNQSRVKQKTIMQKVDRLMTLLQSFTERETEQLKQTDWVRSSGVKMDERAMSNLWDFIGRGLSGRKQKNIAGIALGDE